MPLSHITRFRAIGDVAYTSVKADVLWPDALLWRQPHLLLMLFRGLCKWRIRIYWLSWFSCDCCLGACMVFLALVIQQIWTEYDAGKLPYFKFIEINGKRLAELHELYVQILSVRYLVIFDVRWCRDLFVLCWILFNSTPDLSNVHLWWCIDFMVARCIASDFWLFYP